MEQIMSMTKCCATCDYWMGSRKLFDSFGSRIVVNSRTDHGKCGCSSSGWSSSGETQGCFSCNNYRKWGVLKLQGWLGFFDAEVVKPKPFTDEEEFRIIRPEGGGGTSFHCIFDYVREHNDEIEPVSIVILTDGYAPFPDEEDTMDIPVLWIINNEDVTPPWGKTTRIEIEDGDF